MQYCSRVFALKQLSAEKTTIWGVDSTQTPVTWGAGRLCQVHSCPPRIVQTLPQHPCKTTNIHNFLPDLSSIPGCRDWIVSFLLPWLSTMPKSSGPYIIMDEMSKGVPLLLYKLVSTLRKLPLLLGSTLSRSIDTWISRSGRECSWTAPGSGKSH